jgi:predicted ATPase
MYPDAIRNPQNLVNPHPLDERGENLASVLRNMKQRKYPQAQEMLETLNKVVEGITDYSVQQVGGYLVTSLHHTPPEGQDRLPTFPLAQESDGTLRVLGLLTALYQVPQRPFIAIEEPELTIHPGALSVLCDALQEASLRSQVLVTTHSPELVSHFPVEVFRVVEKVDGVTKVGPIKESQREAIRDKLFSPGELMVIEGLQREADSPKEE